MSAERPGRDRPSGPGRRNKPSSASGRPGGDSRSGDRRGGDSRDGGRDGRRRDGGGRDSRSGDRRGPGDGRSSGGDRRWSNGDGRGRSGAGGNGGRRGTASPNSSTRGRPSRGEYAGRDDARRDDDRSPGRRRTDGRSDPTRTSRTERSGSSNGGYRRRDDRGGSAPGADGRSDRRGSGRNDRYSNDRYSRDRAGRNGGGDRRGANGWGDGQRDERPEPRTEAERRAAEVRARRGPRVPKDPDAEREKIEAREIEQWVDEGSVRDLAQAATARARNVRRSDREDAQLDPEVAAQIQSVADPRRVARLTERLAAAQGALSRDRYDDARRMVTPLIRELPMVAAVHEVNGLANYRLGNWKAAAQSLELAQQLRPDVALLPVLADSYRALRRFSDVDDVWLKIRNESPSHDVMSEARIVAAGALADQGDLKGAIKLMQSGEKPPKRVRDHHLKQWYVLGDLYDRAGDTVAARRWFNEVAANDGSFADVGERLRTIGR